MGLFCSGVFPLLWLAVSALVKGNLAQVLAVLQKGLETAEYKVFVERLA